MSPVLGSNLSTVTLSLPLSTHRTLGIHFIYAQWVLGLWTLFQRGNLEKWPCLVQRLKSSSSSPFTLNFPAFSFHLWWLQWLTWKSNLNHHFSEIWALIKIPVLQKCCWTCLFTIFVAQVITNRHLSGCRVSHVLLFFVPVVTAPLPPLMIRSIIPTNTMIPPFDSWFLDLKNPMCSGTNSNFSLKFK